MFVSSSDRKKWLALSLLVMMLIAAGCVHSRAISTQAAMADDQQTTALERFDEKAGEAYRQTKNGKFGDALLQVGQLGQMLPNLSYNRTLSVEGLHALSDVVLEAKKALTRVTIVPADAELAVGKLRVAADALTHVHDPIWREYGKPVKQHAQLLEQAAAAHSKDAAGTLAKLFELYAFIRPSLLVTHAPEDVFRTDSLFEYLKQALPDDKSDRDAVLNAGKHLRECLDALFAKNDKTAYAPPIADMGKPLYWSLGMASVIGSVLAFAAWRMFRGGSKVVSVRRGDDTKL